MQMSYQDFNDGSNGGGRGASAMPAWAARANEPLVASIDIAAIKKSVSADLKELRKATDLLAKLGAGAKKRPETKQTAGTQLLSISAAARERARATSRTLRDALSIAEDGTAEHKVLTALSDEFKQALLKFQQQVEATTHLMPAAVPSAMAPNDMETGGGWDGCGASTGGHVSDGSTGAGSCSSDAQQQEVHDQQVAQVAANEHLLEERAEGIGQIGQSVQQVADIMQDLALLVNEQGSHIDNIQTNIETAHVNTTRGVKELARANNYQRKTRGRMCIISVCVLVILIVLVLVLKFGLKAFG